MAVINRREFVAGTLSGVVGFAGRAGLAAQNKAIEPDLASLADGNRFQVYNRTISRFTDGQRTGARLSEGPAEGVAFLPRMQFADGTIDCDLKGKDAPQHSFLGIAFHGADALTYDAVYFRPFNFRAQDPIARSHAVQYHANPLHGWQQLRTEQPGQYEQPVNPVPDPNGWFHVRLIVASPKVSVFVNTATAPCLVVNALSGRTIGLLGLWVGNTSGGDFANLRIVPSR
jgi:hypothetical protein